jgi:hypothetical protein
VAQAAPAPAWTPPAQEQVWLIGEKAGFRINVSPQQCKHSNTDREDCNFLRFHESNIMYLFSAIHPSPSNNKLQLVVDGKYTKATVEALQRFLDSNRVDGDHGRFTDSSLAAFLNVAFPQSAHAPMGPIFGPNYTNKPIVLKLQVRCIISHFLCAPACVPVIIRARAMHSL